MTTRPPLYLSPLNLSQRRRKLRGDPGNQGDPVQRGPGGVETPGHLPQLMWDGRGVLSLRRADLCHEVRQLDVRWISGWSEAQRRIKVDKSEIFEIFSLESLNISDPWLRWQSILAQSGWQVSWKWGRGLETIIFRRMLRIVLRDWVYQYLWGKHFRYCCPGCVIFSPKIYRCCGPQYFLHRLIVTGRHLGNKYLGRKKCLKIWASRIN